MSKLFRYIIVISHLIIYKQSYAITILRDQEIEDTIYAIAEPLIKQAQLNDIKINIIADSEVNAFATYNEIFINSGLVLQMHNADMLAAVIAHEIAHIKYKHIISREIINNRLVTISGALFAFSFLSSLANTADLPIAIAFSAANYQKLESFKYSREQEKSADILAIDYLYKTGYDPGAMSYVIGKLNMKNHGINLNPYIKTHPLGYERSSNIEKQINKLSAKNKFHQIKIEKKVTDEQYRRSIAKLYAYTVSNPAINKLPTDNNINLAYQRAIIYYRLKEYQKAAKEVTNLLSQDANNPFFYELQADIYICQRNYIAARNLYLIALKHYPDSYLIRASLIKLELNIAQYDERYLKQRETNIEEQIKILLKNRQGDEYINLTIKSAFFALEKRYAEAYLYLAERENFFGNRKLAIKYAELAKQYQMSSEIKKRIEDFLL